MINTLADSFLGKISPSILDKFLSLYKENKPFEFAYQPPNSVGADLKLSASEDPFYHVIFENLLSKESLEKIEEGLLKIPLTAKSNDIFKFQQSNDLNSFNRLDVIKQIKTEIVLPLKHFCRRITGLNLSDKVDLFYSKYQYSDYLLCHDDRLENRAIAFIYYMTPEDWCKKDGGALLLINSLEGVPTTIQKRVLPVRNTLAFFVVSELSFHEVQEVFSLTKSRNSITGWFHLESFENPTKSDTCHFVRKPIEFHPPVQDPSAHRLFYELVNDIHYYESEEKANEVKDYFAQESQGSFPMFFKPDVYKKLLDELKNNRDFMRKNACKTSERYYYLDDPDAFPNYNITKKVFNLFNSKFFLDYLEKITGLNPYQFDKPKIDLNEQTLEDNIESSDDFIPSKIFKDDDHPTVGSALSIKNPNSLNQIDKVNISQDSDIGKYSIESTPDQISLDFGSEPEDNALKKVTTPIDRHSIESLTASLSFALQLFEHKCFMSLNDSDFKNSSYLDVTFMIMENQVWHDDCGGFFSYVTKDEESEILRVSPSYNCLNIVFRNAKTQKFVKYVNCRSKDLYSPSKYFLFNMEIKISDNANLDDSFSSIYSSDFDMIDIVEGLTGVNGPGLGPSFSDDTSHDDMSEEHGYDSGP